MNKPVTAACLSVGALSLCLGIVALFVPTLPSIPFFVVAAASLIHCSPRIVSWFKRLPVRNCYIDDFMKERSMTRRNKIKTIAVGTAILVAAFFMIEPTWAKVIVIILLVIKLYYLVFCVWTIVEMGHGIAAAESDEERSDRHSA